MNAFSFCSWEKDSICKPSTETQTLVDFAVLFGSSFIWRLVLQRWFPILLSALAHTVAVRKKQNTTLHLHHQLLFFPNRNWMSATELSRILMRVVSKAKLLTWGVGMERTLRSAGVKCSAEIFYFWPDLPHPVMADHRPIVWYSCALSLQRVWSICVIAHWLETCHLLNLL